MRSLRLEQQAENISLVQKEGFNPAIEKITNIYSNTFKAYPKDSVSERNEKTKEWIQPILGLITLGGGAVSLIVSPFVILYELWKNLSEANSFPDFLRNMVETLFKAAPFYLGTSVLLIVAGALSIATTPFTYFVKKPLRYLWTAISDYLDDNAEDNHNNNEENNHTEEQEFNANIDKPGRTARQKLLIKDLYADISEMLDDMIKDFVNTFKPYPKISETQNSQPVSFSYSEDESEVNDSKVLSEASAEWRQPWDGIKTFAKGLFNFSLSPLWVCTSFILNLSRSKSFSNALENVVVGLVLAAPLFLLEQLTAMVRGATQLATTPLTWLVKKPLRHLLTGLRDQGIGYIDIFGVRYSAILYEGSYTKNRTLEQRAQILNLAGATFNVGWSMSNDLKTSFMPYPRATLDKQDNEWQKEKDWMQPWYGISNVLQAATGIAASPFLILRDLYKNLCTAESFIDAMKSLVLGVTVLPVLRLLTSAAYLIRGVTQLATTPLTWAIKIPFRYALTAIRDFSVERKLIERRPSIVQEIKNIKSALQQIDKNPNNNNHDHEKSIKDSLNNVAVKYEAAKGKGQQTEIDSNAEEDLRNRVKTSEEDFVQNAKGYIRLFDRSVKIDGKSQSNNSNYKAKIL